MVARFRGLFGLSVIAGTCVVSLLGACGGEGTGKAASSPADAAKVAASCRRGDSTANYLAYLEFIKDTKPTAQRFLSAAGTDSAAPEDGFQAMQRKGPSYFYGGDSVAKRKIREKLASIGPYASLLIVQRSSATSPGGDSVTLTLGGHYVGGELEGKVADSKRLTVVCADSAWKVVSVTAVPTP